MTNTELMVENTDLRMELKKVMEENQRLRTVLAIGEMIQKNDILNQLVEIVEKEYFSGEKLQDTIEKVKTKLLVDGKLESMVDEFLNPSKEQIAAEIIFRERGIL